MAGCRGAEQAVGRSPFESTAPRAKARALLGLKSLEETGSHLARLISSLKLRKTGIQVCKFTCMLERRGGLLKILLRLLKA